MKLLAIIFIAVISVSSVLPSSGEATETVRCPEGHRVDGSVCRATVVGTRSCRADNLPDFPEEEKCIVSNKCHLPDLSNDNSRLAGENLAELECEDGFTNDAVSRNCIRTVDHGQPDLECHRILTADGQCKVGFNEIVVCPENTKNPPGGCTPRRYEKDEDIRRHCKRNYNEITDNGKVYCVFIEDSPTRFCEDGEPVDETSQKCLSSWDAGRRTCKIGNLIDRKCKEVFTRHRKYSCPRESDLSNVTACFRGIVKGDRCMVRERVEKVETDLNCPEGYSPVDASTSTTCQSEATTQPL